MIILHIVSFCKCISCSNQVRKWHCKIFWNNFPWRHGFERLLNNSWAPRCPSPKFVMSETARFHELPQQVPGTGTRTWAFVVPGSLVWEALACRGGGSSSSQGEPAGRQLVPKGEQSSPKIPKYFCHTMCYAPPMVKQPGGETMVFFWFFCRSNKKLYQVSWNPAVKSWKTSKNGLNCQKMILKKGVTIIWGSKVGPRHAGTDHLAPLA